MISDSALITLSVPQQSPAAMRPALRNYIDHKKGYYTAKRLFDIVLSAVVIITILSWLLPLMAVIIKLSSRGPVFFLQKRVGRGGRSFTCIKFRTMVLNPEANQKQATENDGRITWIGRFLRKSNIDEFPQFFNVLLGSMSIVGPRPHMHADCTIFGNKIPGYKFRNLVKPGITGLSQVKGYHGTVTSDECIARRFYWDALYVRNAGFLLDLKIITKTAVQRIRFLLWL